MMAIPEFRRPGEFDLIRGFRARAGRSPRILTGIGDDGAILETGDAPLVVTTDMLLDGRHFHLASCGARAAGRKAMGVNLSDLAAMAARPLSAFVAVALPIDGPSGLADELFDGLASMAEAHGAPLAGGDTNAWDGPLVVSVTALGTVTTSGPALRSAARPGDILFVTGPLGGSLRGRHLEPIPRIVEALAIRGRVGRLAAIDLSDGLASDLRHVLEESGGLGAILEEDCIPIHQDGRLLAEEDGRSPLDHALSDGEDFELCLAVSESDADLLAADPPEGVRLDRIGVVMAEPGLFLRSADGTRRGCEARGFDHLRPERARP